MSQIDIDELFRRFALLDEELKQLRKEVGEIKWYSQHGTSGPVAYSAAPPGKWLQTQLEEQVNRMRRCSSVTPQCIAGTSYCKCCDSAQWDEEFK